MLSWFKKYWAEILVFACLIAGYILCTATNFTWINTDCDGAHYVYAAKWFYPAHLSSAPLYLIVGHFFTYLPIGTDYYGLAMLSVIGSIGACFFVYLITRHYTRSKWLSLIATIIYGGSAMAISQGTIVETYAIVTMFMLAAYYFALKEKWWIVTVMLGLGLAIHHLTIIAAIVIFFSFKPYRKFKYVFVCALFALFYLYIPITNREPYIWQSESGFFKNFINSLSNTGGMLIGQISIWDLPKRIIEAILVTIVCLGLGVIPAIIALKKYKWTAHSLFWLTIIPILYWVTDLSPQTYVYALPGLAFGACLAGIGLAKIDRKYATAIIGLSAIGLSLFNFNYFDIGRMLDRNMEAVKYYNSLDAVPDGEILIAQQGWEWTMIFVYNKYEGRDIIPICGLNLTDATYRRLLRDTYGIDTRYADYGGTIVEKQIAQAKYIIENNDKVWITMTSDAANYGAVIVKADNDSEIIATPWKPILATPTWKFKPDNPYGIITGMVEVEHWSNVLQSSYSFMTFAMLSTIGAVPCWFLWQIFVKKRKWSVQNVMGKISGVQEKTGR